MLVVATEADHFLWEDIRLLLNDGADACVTKPERFTHMGLELGTARLDEDAWCGGGGTRGRLGSRDDDFSFLHSSSGLQLSEAVEVSAEKLLTAVVTEERLLALRFLFELPLELLRLLF